jgi:tetratricopeptide (TPR) repeat protein
LRRLVPIVIGAALLAVAAGRFVTAPTPSSTPSATATPAPSDPIALVEHLSDVVARDPGDLGSWQSLGTAATRAATAGEPSYYDLAERAFDRADAIAPDRDDTLVGRATLALSRHQFDTALVLSERVHRRTPQNPDALLAMVDALVELGHYERAVIAADDLLEIRPDLGAYARVSYLRQLHGDLDGAISAMREALVAGAERPGDTAAILTFLGDLELARGRPGAALTEYRRALDRAPDLPLAELGRAHALAARGDRRAAIEVLERLMDRTPIAGAAGLLGDLQAATGRDRDAERAWQMVRELDGAERDAGVAIEMELSLFEADHGSPREALALARIAHDARPDNVFTSDALAWALHRTGDQAGARRLMDRALRLGTASSQLLYHDAAIRAAAGDITEARRSLQRALRDPWFSFALHDEAVVLASRLDVPAPAAWSQR